MGRITFNLTMREPPQDGLKIFFSDKIFYFVWEMYKSPKWEYKFLHLTDLYPK